jgi:hypothetical protein
MSKGKSSGQATNLTDPALALAVYRLRADVTHFGAEFETYVVF